MGKFHSGIELIHGDAFEHYGIGFELFEDYFNIAQNRVFGDVHLTNQVSKSQPIENIKKTRFENLPLF